jgi:hypothetical protein
MAALAAAQTAATAAEMAKAAPRRALSAGVEAGLLQLLPVLTALQQGRLVCSAAGAAWLEGLPQQQQQQMRVNCLRQGEGGVGGREHRPSSLSDGMLTSAAVELMGMMRTMRVG